MSFKGKTVVVTGSSRGIGAATARLAKKRGAHVVVHGKTDSDELGKIAKELDALKIFCDVADRKAVIDAVEKVVGKYGTIDVLVNSAGMVKSKPFLELDDQDFYDDFNVNLLGTVHFCQAVIPHMSDGSAVVNVSSIRGIHNLSSARAMPYCISKSGVISLSIGLAKQFGPKIRVNCVAPGGTETDIAKHFTPELRKKYTDESMIKRIASPEEVARTILFLASDEASLITGKVISTDGGYEVYGK